MYFFDVFFTGFEFGLIGTTFFILHMDEESDDDENGSRNNSFSFGAYQNIDNKLF
jgi:hypothetical protein